jgi:tetratricopeptide (TPR) repeat protein
VAAVAAYAVNAVSTLSFVERVSGVSFSEVAPHTMRVPPGTREEYLVLPYYAMDARWWVVHTKQMLREGGWRVRETQMDNAPDGREVHWSSPLVWLLAVLAWVRSWGTGMPAEYFVADAALAAGPLLLFGLLGGLTWLAARRFGWFPAAFFALVNFTSYPVLRTCLTGEADHHVLVIFFAAGTVLCLVCGGAGFVRTKGKGSASDQELPSGDGARAWFAGAGVLGGAALWVSAATAIPILGASLLGGVLCGWAFGRGPLRRSLDPGLWLTWGGWGCLTSLGFYLLEYFPRHMGWRLEVNHPLHALAWLAGCFLASRFLAWSVRQERLLRNPSDIVLGMVALAALAAPLLMVAWDSERFFWVGDKFLLSLHQEFINEFQSLPTLVLAAGGNPAWLLYYPWPVAVVASAVFLAARGGLGDEARRSLLLLAPPTLLMQALAIWQVRWTSAAFGLWAVCALVVLAGVASERDRSPVQQRVFIGLLACGWLSLLFSIVPQFVVRSVEARTCLETPIPQEIAGNLLLRDVAHRLIQSSPARVPVVLTGPNASTEMTYHSGLRTVGTLYWENMPGLKSAARIFAAPDAEEAKRELTEAGVTHIVIPSWDNFGEAYTRLLAESGEATMGETTFLKSLLNDAEIPDWLRPFAYPIPSGSGLDTKSVRIFAVIPEQSKFEALYFRGLYHFEIGEPDKARPLFEQALVLRPADPRPADFLRMIGNQEQDAGNAR